MFWEDPLLEFAEGGTLTLQVARSHLVSQTSAEYRFHGRYAKMGPLRLPNKQIISHPPWERSISFLWKHI